MRVRSVLLHGFAGDPASWDVLFDGDRVALPGHLGGGPSTNDWAGNRARGTLATLVAPRRNSARACPP